MNKILAFLLLYCGHSLNAQQLKKVFKTIANTVVYTDESKQQYTFTGAFMVDADGAPKAYHKDDKMALDYLANGGKPGNWWALVTDTRKPSGKPVFQKATDPAPGYYISMTSLENQAKDHADPTRFVNSGEVPYIAIPWGFSKDFKLGDIAFVYNKQNGKKCFAIYADVGPKDLLGEGSIKLAKELGINSSPKKGGTESGIGYVLLIGSGKRKMLTVEEINAMGKAKLSEAEITVLMK